MEGKKARTQLQEEKLAIFQTKTTRRGKTDGQGIGHKASDIWQRTHTKLRTQGDYKGSCLLINKQVTRWVGSRQIDMRAHGTQKTRTEATCSHKTKTHAHGQKTIHQPCAKQDTNTQLMRKLISHVFTQEESTQPMKYKSCVPHSTRYNMNARSR